MTIDNIFPLKGVYYLCFDQGRRSQCRIYRSATPPPTGSMYGWMAKRKSTRRKYRARIVFKMSGTCVSSDKSKRGSKRKFKSNSAADKALRETSVVLTEQLNLFETTIHLHHINGLTSLEFENLTHSHTTKLEQKQYLVTTGIPGRGYYRGMMLLRREIITV